MGLEKNEYLVLLLGRSRRKGDDGAPRRPPYPCRSATRATLGFSNALSQGEVFKTGLPVRTSHGIRRTMIPTLKSLSLCVLSSLVFALPSAQAASASTYALLIGGGFTFNSTYASDYRGIRDLKIALLKRGVPEKQIRTYFAEGCRNGNVRIAAVLKKPCGFFDPDGRDIDLSNERKNVLAGFAKIAAEIPTGGTLVIGIATHGDKNGDLALQNRTKLSLDDFRALLDGLKTRGVRTIFLSSACYSGNLHRLADANTCAFTSTDADHLTSEWMWSDSILSAMARAIGEGANFLGAFESVRAAEAANQLSLHRRYLNGMDFLSLETFGSAPTAPATKAAEARLESWKNKSGYGRFDVRILDTFVGPAPYLDAIECAKTSI